MVNIDPVFRLTMYHVAQPCRYSKISYEVGDHLIPEKYFKLKAKDRFEKIMQGLLHPEYHQEEYHKSVSLKGFMDMIEPYYADRILEGGVDKPTIDSGEVRDKLIDVVVSDISFMSDVLGIEMSVLPVQAYIGLVQETADGKVRVNILYNEKDDSFAFKYKDKIYVYESGLFENMFYMAKERISSGFHPDSDNNMDDAQNHDDAAFIKETLSNYDIPIADPINNVYSILAGVRPGTIETPQGQNEIGLARYSTTIGRAMNAYKGDAAWSGAMFNSGISNRQIRNSAEYAIWALDSIKKTVKPGPFNVQSPAAIEFLRTVLDPDNWDRIFTDEDIANAINIDNEPIGGEDWQIDENGEIVGYTSVENPNREQRMNTILRKFMYPAVKKIIPAFDRLRTSNTIDNQKPGTADAQYELLKMLKEKWEGNDAIRFDPTLVDQDLQAEARALRQRKHDKDGRLLYETDIAGGRRRNRRVGNLLMILEDSFDSCVTAEDLKHNIFSILNERVEYGRALQRFDELCSENPDATMEEIRDWFVDLDTLV